MEKRSNTVSARISPELETRARAMAELDGRSLSDLIEHLLSEYVEEKRRVHEELSRVFGAGQSLQGKR